MSEPIAVNAAGELLVCSECGEYVIGSKPRTWTYPWGPAPDFSHVDGEPLCPVISTADGVSGYVPAEPVTENAFDGWDCLHEELAIERKYGCDVLWRKRKGDEDSRIYWELRDLGMIGDE